MQVRWAILGVGTIAGRFAASLSHEPRSSLVALSGRTRERVDALAHEWGVDPARCYERHEDLLADPDVDAIYLALPHGMHHEWARRALEAGKAVLCEKPATLSAVEMQDLAAAARASGRLFMEAMKPRFTPLHARVSELLASGELGPIVSVETHQLIHMPRDRGGYLADPVQGGVLYDMGCYNASWIEELLPGDVVLVEASRRLNGAVDWYSDARLLVGGVPARLEVGAEEGYRSLCVIGCERGRIEVDLLHRPTHASVLPDGHDSWQIDAPYEVDDFFGEVAHFVSCLEQGLAESPVMPLAASVRQAQIIDTIRAGW